MSVELKIAAGGCAIALGLVACSEKATQEYRPLGSSASATTTAAVTPAGASAEVVAHASASTDSSAVAGSSAVADASAVMMPSAFQSLTPSELAMLADRLEAGPMALSTAGPSSGQAGSVVAGMAPGFKRCYNDGLKKDPKLQGSMKVSAKIGPKGEVLSADSIDVKGLTEEVANCIKARVMTATFSPPEGGGANIIIPVSFYPQ